MPQRPSKKARQQSGAKPGIGKKIEPGNQAQQQRRQDDVTKAILGKFQGRKSI